MKLIDADKLPVQKIYHVDEAGYGATFYMVDIEDIKTASRITYTDIVPHGEWEIANDGTHFCSNCGCDATYRWDDINRYFINSADDVPDRISNYCPNCGARMDGEKR